MIEEVPMRRKGFKTKVMAVVLSASMAMSVCPATAFAAPEEGEAVVEGEAIDADAEDVKEETAAAAEAAAAEKEADAEETIVEEETEEVLTAGSRGGRGIQVCIRTAYLGRVLGF